MKWKVSVFNAWRRWVQERGPCFDGHDWELARYITNSVTLSHHSRSGRLLGVTQRRTCIYCGHGLTHVRRMGF